MGHKRLNKARKQSANTKKGRRQGALRKKEDKKQKKKFTIIMKLTQIDQEW